MTRVPTMLDPEEDTGVVVRRVTRARRRTRLGVFSGMAVVAVIGTTWAVMGSRDCQRRLNLDFGTREEGRAPRATPVEKSWVVHPGAKTATVRVALTEPALVWVDAEEKGKVSELGLELAPGVHTLRAQTRRFELQQMLTVEAGEEFEVRFRLDIKDVELIRVPPPGRSK